MSSIQEILASILQAVYGKDVRQAIHDGVEMAYNKADNAETSAAAAAEAASGSQNSAAASAQAAANSASSASGSADQAEQYKNEAFHTTPAGYEDFVGEVNSSLNYLAETGVKNVLNLTLNSIINANIGHASFSGNVCSISGIDFTVSQSSDGGIEIDVNGVATANVQLFLIPNLSNNTFKNMILNGSPASSDDCSLLVSYFQNGTWKSEQWSYNMRDTVLSLDYPQILISVFVKNGTSVNHLKFYPMIRDASISDTSYQPYAQSNVALTEKVTSVNSSLDNAKTMGALNLIDYNKVDSSTNVSYKPNTLNGTIKLINTGTSGFRQVVLLVPVSEFYAGKQLTFSLNSIDSSHSHASDVMVYLNYYINNLSETWLATLTATNKKATVNVPSNATEIKVIIRMSQSHSGDLVADDYCIINGLQLELGDKASDYSPFAISNYGLTRLYPENMFTIYQQSTSIAATLERTGVKFKLTKPSLVTVKLEYTNSKPKELEIMSTVPSATSFYGLFAHIDTDATYCGLLILTTYLESGNYEIAARSASAASNNLVLSTNDSKASLIMS